MQHPSMTQSPIPRRRSALSRWLMSLTASGRDVLRSEMIDNEMAERDLLRHQQIMEVIEALPYMDPDSTRFVEYLWMLRQRARLNTHSAYFDISSDIGADFNDIIDLFRDHFECVYESKHLFRGLEFDDDALPILYVVADCSDSGSISINMFGEEHLVKNFQKHFEDNYRPPKTIEIKTLNGFTPQGPDVSVDTVFEDQSDFGLDEFYPFLKNERGKRIGVDELIEQYKNSKSSVLVLIGPPGTGKTTFLRTLMFRMGRENVAHCSDKGALSNPGLVGWIRSIGKHSIVGIEDADEIVRSRRDGNDQMSSLLSYADGVVKHDNKVVIATNLDNTDTVDSALTRPGRAFRVIVFRKLKGEEINNVRKAMGKSPVETDRELTLSEVINHEDVAHLSQSKGEENGFGFAPRQTA